MYSCNRFKANFFYIIIFYLVNFRKKNVVVAQNNMRTIEKPLQDFNLHSFNIWYIALPF